ncbi:MAG: VOC family protein [Pseudomonadota bacterium]
MTEAHALQDAPLPKDVVVWAEIPVTDMDRAKAFYAAVLGHALVDNNDGPNPMAVLPNLSPETGIAGHLYPGKPAPRGEGPTVHLAAPDTLEATMERVRDAGGEVVSPPIAIPSGRFVYCHDLDGNSVGFFQFDKA